MRCRLCKKIILEGNPARAGYGWMHQSCKQKVREAASDLKNQILNCEKITELNLSFDIENLREDGKLNDSKEFTMDKFFNYFVKSQKTNNSDWTKVDLKIFNVLVPKKERKYVKIGVIFHQNKFRKIGFYKFVWFYMYSDYTLFTKFLALFSCIMPITKRQKRVKKLINDIFFNIIWNNMPKIQLFS